MSDRKDKRIEIIIPYSDSLDAKQRLEGLLNNLLHLDIPDMYEFHRLIKFYKLDPYVRTYGTFKENEIKNIMEERHYWSWDKEEIENCSINDDPHYQKYTLILPYPLLDNETIDDMGVDFFGYPNNIEEKEINGIKYFDSEIIEESLKGIPNGINDSGERISYGENKAVREPSTGKGRFDLITPFGLARLARWYELGSQKYSERNWEKGIPFSRCFDSAMRHMNKYMMGMTDEDHLAAACWNLLAIMHYEENGQKDLDDLPHYNAKIPESAYDNSLNEMLREIEMVEKEQLDKGDYAE